MATVWPPLVAAHSGALPRFFALGFALLAAPVIALVYGAAFRPDAALALATGLAAGFRVLRTPFSQLAVATGRTGDLGAGQPDPRAGADPRRRARLPWALPAGRHRRRRRPRRGGRDPARLAPYPAPPPPDTGELRMSTDPITEMVACNLCTGMRGLRGRVSPT